MKKRTNMMIGVALVTLGVTAAATALSPSTGIGRPIAKSEAMMIRGGCKNITNPNCVNHSGTVMGRDTTDSDSSFEADLNTTKICCDAMGAKSTKNCAGG